MRQSIILNKTYHYRISNYHFDGLDETILREIFKDGRAFSHFIEPWLAQTFPLIHVQGCKKYDHIDSDNCDIKYDQKTFTKGGCKFMPSNMIGEGRKFDKAIFEEKARGLIYIIVSNLNFPDIKIKFVKGNELATKYPNGTIPLKDLVPFFD